MPGAGKRRGANDRKNARNPAQEQPPVAAPGQNDGPSSQPPGPPSAGRAAGRGRPPPNVPQPPNAPSTTQSIRSGSHDPSASGAPDAPQQLKRDPARDYPMVLNRNVDFAGNAYNLINQVSYILVILLRHSLEVLSTLKFSRDLSKSSEPALLCYLKTNTPLLDFLQAVGGVHM